MAEWIECKISDIGTVVGGATPSTRKSENYEGGNIAWITPKDLSTLSGRYIQRGERNITEVGLKSCSAQLLPQNTVLFSSRAPIGYVAIAANEVCTNQGFKSVVPNESTDPLFLFYLLKYNKNKIEGMGSGTTFKEVSGNTMKNIIVRVPSDKEVQRNIASMLGSIDDKIEENERINNNLLNQLMALFSEKTLPNKIYESVSLNQLCSFQEGYVNPSQTEPEYFDGDIKWLRAVDINESFIINTSRTLTNTGFRSAGKSAVLFQPNTIAISKSGTIGRLGIIADYMCGNRAVINIQPNEPKYLPFIYAFLKSKQHEFPDLAVGSVQKNLYVSVLESLAVGLPISTDLNEFCSVGNDLLALMETTCQETLKLIALRDTLLPKLMSGELDVSNIDI